MVSIISFFIVLIISFLLIRICSVMLKLTGISSDIARFQASSAFTGTGFTSTEAEVITSHPVRRRIIIFLMFIGNAGFISFVSSLIISLTSAESKKGMFINAGIIIGGTILLFMISRSKTINKILSKIIESMLKKWTKLNITDYENLLKISDDYQISKTNIGEKSNLAEKTLSELKLSEKGILILGINRDKKNFIGTPHGRIKLKIDDELILYGKEEDLKKLCEKGKE